MELVLIPLFFMAFAAIWSGVVFLTSSICGWRGLAREFRAAQKFAGQKWTWQSGEMRGISIRNCLEIGADGRGLSLAVLPLFRIGYPPLYVPWSRIVVTPKSKWYGDGVEFRLGGPKGVPLWVAAGLAAKLERASATPPAGA